MKVLWGSTEVSKSKLQIVEVLCHTSNYKGNISQNLNCRGKSLVRKHFELISCLILNIDVLFLKN